jgi:formate hydrogenlyase subunit 6/NADH:ubiquinone oxidoreductase subunit I
MAMQRELIKNAFDKPCTLIYPFEKAVPPKGLRGKHQYDPEKCIGCGLCARVCPSFAIELIGPPGPKCEGIKVDLGKCLFCQQCEEVCPTKAIILTEEYELAVYDKASGILVFKREPKEPKARKAKKNEGEE